MASRVERRGVFGIAILRAMRDFVAITKALADEKRLRMLLALRGRELCLCQLVALVELAPSTTSKHMSILRQAGLVEARKSGRWVYYRLAEDSGTPVVRNALAWVKDSLINDPSIRADGERLRDILAAMPAESCTSPCIPEGRCTGPEAEADAGAGRVASDKARA